jgi:hypothetical protein
LNICNCIISLFRIELFRNLFYLEIYYVSIMRKGGGKHSAAAAAGRRAAHRRAESAAPKVKKSTHSGSKTRNRNINNNVFNYIHIFNPSESVWINYIKESMTNAQISMDRFYLFRTIPEGNTDALIERIAAEMPMELYQIPYTNPADPDRFRQGWMHYQQAHPQRAPNAQRAPHVQQLPRSFLNATRNRARTFRNSLARGASRVSQSLGRVFRRP